MGSLNKRFGAFQFACLYDKKARDKSYEASYKNAAYKIIGQVKDHLAKNGLCIQDYENMIWVSEICPLDGTLKQVTKSYSHKDYEEWEAVVLAFKEAMECED